MDNNTDTNTQKHTRYHKILGTIVMGVIGLGLITSIVDSRSNAQSPTNNPSIEDPSGSPNITQSDVERIIWNELSAHPERIMNIMQNAMREKALQGTPLPPEAWEQATKLTAGFSIGDNKRPISMIVLIDPLCPACRAFYHTLDAIHTTNPDIHIRVITLPLLGNKSIPLTLMEEAFYQNDPNHAWELYSHLEETPGTTTPEILSNISDELHIIPNNTPKDNAQKIKVAEEYAATIRVSGTPAILFPDRIITGSVPAPALLHIINNNNK